LQGFHEPPPKSVTVRKKRIMPRLFSGYCQDGFPLDDHARAQISIELDYELPYLIHKGACEEEKRALIRALNLARRQLTPVAKREIIAAQIRETPKFSNRRIAKALGVSHSTVMSVRQERSAAGAENRRSVAYPRRWATPLPDCSGHNVCVRDENGLTATCRSAVHPPHWVDARWSAGPMPSASNGLQDGAH